MHSRFLAIATASLPAISACAPVRVPPSTATHERLVDSLFAPYAAAGAPGAGVIVIDRGQVVLSRSWGLANLGEPRTPASERTSYRLASLSKQFTAAAVLLLVKEGKLGLDEPIGAVLPDLPQHSRAATIRQLLTHTSGVPDYEDFIPDSQTTQVHDGDVPGLIARSETTYFAAGTSWRYSNSGYALLALAVERRSGMPFARFLRERIFLPLGMSATVAYEKGISEVPNRAFGYRERDGRFVDRDQSSTSAVLGDGGVYSSLHDLAKWDAALDARTLLDDDLLRLAWTPQRLANGISTRYGFGWFVDRDSLGLKLTHHGETSGFTNFFLKRPEVGLTVIVLTNRASGAPWNIAEAIARLYRR